MKKVLLLSLFVAFAAITQAQTSDRKWSLGAGAGAYGTLNNGGIGIIPELSVGTFLSPKLDLVLQGNLGVFRTLLNSDLDLANANLNLRYKLSDETKKLRPYLFAGPGFLADNSETGLSFDLGLGSKYYISPATAVYLSAGYINGIETTRGTGKVTESLWKVTAGLILDLGKAKDSDMDGVADNKDKCPNTPAGVAVDATGCPIDTDGDGVADYIDDCPTVAGLTSLKGCPDSDKDGIADKDDACPDVAGLAALKGCPDSDGDGVADKDDKCANTPKGYKVDSTGCPLDTDKDGIVDSEDDCPTVAGTKENKGCPVKEKSAEEIKAEKLNVTPVYFDSNKAAFNASEKAKIDKVVSILKENASYKLNVSGYADSQGDDNYNLNLSKNRNSSVVKSIVAGGIKSNRISQKALGEAKPAATNDTEEGRALNRRVEFEVIEGN